MTGSGKHIHGTFDKALDALHRDVLMMSALAERNLANAMNGLFTRDDDLCAAAIADDEDVDQLEKQVDRDGIEIMLRFQPVASDLRQVISAMKVSGNLERVADQAVSIARRSRRLTQHPELAEVSLLEPMYQEAMSMLKDSLRAYGENDIELAISLQTRDHALDEIDGRLSEEITESMVRKPGSVTGYLNLIFIARHLERVGDHAKNIGEDAVYAAAAEDVRHNYGKSANRKAHPIRP